MLNIIGRRELVTDSGQMYLPLLKNGDFLQNIKRIVGDTIPRGKSKSSNLRQ